MTVFAGDPIYASDFNSLYNITYGKPICTLTQQVAQSLADNTTTAITFGTGSENIDTANIHDVTTNNTRITPNVAGTYQFSGMVAVGSDATLTTLQVAIGKNGATQVPQHRQPWGNPSIATAGVRTETATATLTANGTTDYFELYVLRDNTANTAINTNVGGSTASYFECIQIA